MSTTQLSRFAPIRIALLIGALWLVVFTSLRLGLTVFTGTDAVPLSLWPVLFAKGLAFDLAVLAVTLAPVLLYEALLPNKWRQSRWHRVLRTLWFVLSVFIMIFGATSEITFWIEFSTRFNFIAVDYLLYTQEVIGNIRQSYPVPAILLGLTTIACIIYAGTHKWLHDSDRIELTRRQRLALALGAILLPTVSLSVSNVDQMQGMGNAFAEELSGNGLFTLAAAMRRNELDYDKFYMTMDQKKADAILESLEVERPPLDVVLANGIDSDEAEDVLPMAKRPTNIVLISVESLSASFLGTYGNPKGITPRLDALAKEGLNFTHFFATGTRTVRGLEALSLGIPPAPGQAVVRRPNNQHLATLGELLKPQGVTPYFFYGGYGYFDNMNAYFEGNSYQVIDRTDIPKQDVMFENVWGVADEVLFTHVLRTLGKKHADGSPFFAHIMTTSNHRPYTYPDGRIDIPSPGGRDGAVKYTDYAIGQFLDQARSQSWFKDTLFIITADHCASVAGKSKLPVAGYHIPLIFYAPGLIKPDTFDTRVSQIDLAPTIVELFGKKGDDHFFGRSFFEHGDALKRVFISNYQSLGYWRNDTLTVLLPKGQVESYQVDPKTLATTPTPIDPRLLDETIAYYQSASRAFKAGALVNK